MKKWVTIEPRLFKKCLGHGECENTFKLQIGDNKISAMTRQAFVLIKVRINHVLTNLHKCEVLSLFAEFVSKFIKRTSC
ncbi:hypothetical protein BpHYR1_016753 [Brachionus plicatilis]|uniref:Uncharacterized protein n=1 Tax=Brachionus plicatilis TaxID=10195 RepID=A0A3M7Q155_BRAPC|nr:hypothetical protein BpHYR1_016753 [Brachionus plicatilis]